MNRKIEFRGLTEDGKWVYGNLVYTISMNNGVQKHHALIGNLTEVIPETVGEFTSKKNIYEGDLLRGKNNRIYEVYWDSDKAAWYVKFNRGDNKPDSTDLGFILTLHPEIKVIGTIHDNKLKKR